MYNIIIFGTGKTSKIVATGLSDQVNIIAYCDNDKTKWYKKLNERDIIPPSNLKDIYYDYIIIASQYNEIIYNQLIEMKIPSNKIFEFFKYINTSFNIVLWNIKNLLENNSDAETLITGISYAQRGIDVNQFNKKTYNLACGSQDLYYDYHIIKFLIENYREKLKKVNNVIIGLCYYSFQYDMSLSAMKNRVWFYYEAIGLGHHGNKRDIMCDYRKEKIEIAKKIFKCDDNANLIVDWLTDKKDVCKINESTGKNQALIDGNKNYPQTVKEYTRIFNEYLKLLKDNEIKVTVVVFPLTKYYSRNFPKKIKEEFYRIVDKAQKEYGFKFLDYSENHDFKDDEFYDVSHLNSSGAKRFSKLLNDKLSS